MSFYAQILLHGGLGIKLQLFTAILEFILHKITRRVYSLMMIPWGSEHYGIVI